MIRLVLAGLLILSISACATHSDKRLQELYDSASSQLWRGDLTEASRLAKEGATAAGADAGSVWSWKFTLLTAEIRLVGREVREAQALLEKSPPDTPQYAWAMAKHRYLQGQLLIVQGKLADALGILQDARKQAEAASATDVEMDAGALSGQALMRLRRWPEGESVLQETVARARERGDHYREAVALLNLGTGQLDRDRFDHALQYFEGVLASTDLSDRMVYAVALTNAGICYHRLGEVNRAIDLQKRAVASHERPGRPRVYYARALGELGTTYLVNGDVPNGTANLRRAIDVGKQAGLSADAARWASNLSVALIRQREWDQAEEANNESRTLGGDRPDLAGYQVSNSAEIAAGRGRYAEAARLFNDTLGFAKDRPSLQWSAHEGLGRLAVTEKKPQEAERHFEAALGVVERTRSELLKADYRLSFLTRLVDLYGSYVDVLVAQGKGDRALAIADSSRARVLAERHGVSAPTRTTAAALQRVASQLNAVLLFYWLGDKSYAWQVTPERVRLIPLSISASRADTLVESYQRSIVASLSDPLASASSSGDEIYSALIEPVARGIPHGSRVVIVPDGALSRLNVEALPVPGPQRHYWIEDVEVAITPSLGTLSSPTAPHVKEERPVLLIGDPVSSDPAFPQLRYASAEMTAVSNAFAGRTEVYRADQATPGRYRETKLDRFGIVHFTAHAAANAESPLDSAVILSKDASGYKLYARDVAEQPLSSELVTISACRSAGERTYAGEGLVGFAWAFLRAGAQRVIAGLWDVDDRSTADLMGRVYALIAQGRSPAAALRAAKLEMIGRGGAGSKPYYWAPFQLFIGSKVVP